jgi:putative transposase
VIDGSKALRAAIGEMFADCALVQRCRTHKLRNVLERIKDDSVRAQTRAVMHAAYQHELGIYQRLATSRKRCRRFDAK